MVLAKHALRKSALAKGFPLQDPLEKGVMRLGEISMWVDSCARMSRLICVVLLLRLFVSYAVSVMFALPTSCNLSRVSRLICIVLNFGRLVSHVMPRTSRMCVELLSRCT